MNGQRLPRRLLLWVFLMLLIVGTLACEEQPTGPRVWVDVPLDGSSVPAGTRVPVVSHAYAREGVAEVLLSVNGEAYRRNPPAQPDASFSKVSQDWIPQQAGDYVLQVKAFSKNGVASNPATVRVKVLGTPTPVGPVTRVITPVTPVKPVTPVPAPDLEIVNVEAVVAGFKDVTPICNTLVTYRNAGTGAVQRDFTIQFHFNGVPTMANTVAGGLLPGASAQITFVYQFEGSPYIGINLDSTNVVTEGSETNNAFAEARLCGGPTPVPLSISVTPPISVTPTTPTLTPTPTPTVITPPPPAGCSGTPNISSFSASPSTIQRGQSATLSWGAVSNADAVSIQPGIGGVGTPGSTAVLPQQTTTYTLTAYCGGNTTTRQVTINVSTPVPPTHTPTPTRTRTPTPHDGQGPPAPGIVGPRGNLTQCVNSVTLDWNAVSDPSGIKNYIVKWVRDGAQTGGTVTTSTQHTISVSCDSKSHTYNWSVQAVDNAGNPGGTSSASFSVPAELH